MSFNLKAKLRKLDDDTIQRLFQRERLRRQSERATNAEEDDEANNAVAIDPSVAISTATSRHNPRFDFIRVLIATSKLVCT